jgi:putative spermidine/putrescine transport system permease protein
LAGWFDRLLFGYFGLILIFIYAPILSVVLFSFNEGAGLSFPLTGLSTRWYGAFFNDRQAIRSIFESVRLAGIVTSVTTLLCVMTAISFRRRPFGRTTLFYLILLGIPIPGQIYGLGAAIFYTSVLNTDLSIWTAVPVEVLWTLPFGLVLMLSRFDPELASYEQAARTLGASEGKVFREVTLPLIGPHVIAVALFSFTLSFGELLRSLFVVGTSPTLPIYVFSTVSNKALTPDFYALGTVIIGMSFALLVAAGLLLLRGPGKRIL